MLMVMSCCHECVSEEAEGRVKFQGPSPDEIALVEAAWKMSYRFVSVKNGVINLLVGGR
jgi:phospholipid-translocating ATPase